MISATGNSAPILPVCGSGPYLRPNASVIPLQPFYPQKRDISKKCPTGHAGGAFLLIIKSVEGAIIKLQKGVGLSPILEAGEGIQLDAVNALKDALFNIGICLFQFPQQEFDLLPLTLSDPVALVFYVDDGLTVIFDRMDEL